MKMFKKLTPSWSDDTEGKMQAAANAIYDLLAEVKHLRAENESLLALATLGRWCLDNSQNDDYVYVAGEENIIDKAETLGLLKVQGMGDHRTMMETDLAKVLNVDP